MIVPATMAVGISKPRSRLEVQCVDEIAEDECHERLVVHRVANDEYEVLTPAGDGCVEAASGDEFHALLNGQARYPRDAKGAMHAFADVLEATEIKGYVIIGLGLLSSAAFAGYSLTLPCCAALLIRLSCCSLRRRCGGCA